jgi:hypothetical protein
MICNDQELAVSRRKLAILEHGRDMLESTEPNPALRSACRVTISRLINQIIEEIGRYGWGRHEKLFLRRTLKTPEEAANTRRKLGEIEDMIRTRLQNSRGSHVDSLSLGALRRMRNKLQEQVSWYDAKTRECVH